MRYFILCCAIFAAAFIPTASAEIKVPELVDAIYRAEGGARAKKPFGISVPCEGYTACRKICTNTVKNNYKRWVRAGRPGKFLDFLGAKYAPVSAHKLNKNWVHNVERIYEKFRSRTK